MAMAVSLVRETPPWALLLLRVRCELDQNAEYASAHYEREDLGQGYRTVSSGFPFEA
jgi:hypothetical protein